MQKRNSEADQYILRDQLPIGFFLSGSEEENLRFVFEAPELIRNAPHRAQHRERYLAAKPLLVSGLLLACLLAGLWQGIGGA